MGVGLEGRSDIADVDGENVLRVLACQLDVEVEILLARVADEDEAATWAEVSSASRLRRGDSSP